MDTPLALMGIFGIASGIVASAKSFRMRRWRAAPGRVTSSDIDPGTLSAPRWEIEYEYTVDGRAYIGDRVALAQRRRHGYEDAMEQLRRYPQGQSVEVFYDPRDPAQSVLEKDDAIGGYIAMGVGLVILLIALFI